MASPKRERQDLGRQKRIQQLEVEKKIAKRNASFRRYGAIAGVAVLIVGLLVVFNRDGDDSSDVATDATTTSGAPDTVQQTAPGLSAKPEVTTPKGEPPKELQKTDIRTGSGPEAVDGATVQMQYVGVSWSTGEEFDSSWSRNAEPFEFTIGQGQVIKGWDQGIPGMKVGGRRQLVIPPDLAYGDTGSGSIKPNETLVFVVDLVSVTAPEAGVAVTGETTTTSASGATAPTGSAGATPAAATTTLAEGGAAATDTAATDAPATTDANGADTTAASASPAADTTGAPTP